MSTEVRFTIAHAASVLLEQRRLGPPAADFQTRFDAVAIDPGQVPVEAVRAYQLDGRPLVWWNLARTAAVVDAAALTDLIVVDATALPVGARAEVGAVRAAHLDRRTLLELLLHARVVATYAHLGAELTLIDEQTDATGYRAQLAGHHTYYTSRRNVAPLAFAVAVDPAGAITVTGA